MGLRIYTVHLPPPGSADPTPTLAKEGFSWPAFFLGVIWALWHRLWIEAAGLLAVFIAVGVAFDVAGLGEPLESLITVAIALFVGFHGNDWRRASLRRRGYQDAGVVAGPDSDNALRRFLDLRAVTAQPARATVHGATVHGPAAPAAPVGGAIAGWYSTTVQPPGQSERGYPPDHPSGSRAGA